MSGYDLSWRAALPPLAVLWGLPAAGMTVGALMDLLDPSRAARRTQGPCGTCCAFEVPEVFHEPHITSGYRKPPQGYLRLLKSAFQWHNETMNVWSDVIAALFFVGWAGVAGLGKGGGLKSGSRSARMAFALSALSFALCKGASATAHLLGSRSQAANRFWFSLDFAGLCACVAGGAPATLASSAKSFPVPEGVYLAAVGAASVKCFHTMTASHGEGTDGKTARLMAFGGLLLLYKSPVALRILKREMHEFGQGGGSASATLGVASILMAGASYACKIPERFGPPGRYDLYLHSHLLWHLFANSALLFQHSFFARALTRTDCEWRRAPSSPRTIAVYALVMTLLLGREVRGMWHWFKQAEEEEFTRAAATPE